MFSFTWLKGETMAEEVEQTEQPDPVQIRILVLDRGFVLVCRCEEPTQFAFWMTVTDARIIRRWGTTRGLVQLKNGPTSETVLDELAEEENIPTRAIIRIIKVNQDAWEPHLELSEVEKRANAAVKPSKKTRRSRG